jgi:RimJ/RimL family protein N-acetyltransferase
MDLRAFRAAPHHLLLLFNWACDPGIRRTSVFLDPPTLKSYRKWFRQVLGARSNYFLIIEGYHPSLQWIPIGQVRFNEHGEMGVSLGREFRGKHLAARAIQIGVQYLKRHSSLTRVLAYIKHNNRISARAFEGAGFRFVWETTIEGHACRAYAYNLDRDTAHPCSSPTPHRF